MRLQSREAGLWEASNLGKGSDSVDSDRLDSDRMDSDSMDGDSMDSDSMDSDCRDSGRFAMHTAQPSNVRLGKVHFIFRHIQICTR